MSLILPEWVAHYTDDKKKRSTIFSVAVHPDGSRLATAGLDTKVRIWATQSILDSQVEAESGSHKLLSTLSRHTGSVLVVRWSNSGRFLASGSDDTIALIWDLDPSGLSGASFGSTDVNVEQWRPHRRLAGHESDIVDLAWAEDDEYIATVGLDSMVYVWSGSTFEKLRRIDGHQGFVKGVVFDPLGQYLATASDDKSVKVWRTSDWGLEAQVTDPFASSPSSTFFRRPSWSPDGNLLVCANAMSGPVFVASVVKRAEWSSDIYFVGHENSVVVSSFSPKIFVGFDGGTHSCVIALGSLDQSVSIWVTGLAQPVMVARDIFERQVMDLSWSADGYTLYASSSDGTVAVFKLTEDMLSQALSSDRLQQARARHGFKRIRTQAASHISAQAVGTLDRPNVLQVRKAGPRPAAPAVRPAAGRPERLQQEITITKDGKRRIRPTPHGDDGFPVAGPAPPPPMNGTSMNIPPGGTTTIGFGTPAETGPVESIASTTSIFAPAIVQSPAPAAPASASVSAEAMLQMMAKIFQQQQTKAGESDDEPVYRGEKRKAAFGNDDDIEPLTKLPKGRSKAEIGRTLGGDKPRDAMGPPVPIRRRIEGSIGVIEHGVVTGVRLPVPDLMNVLKREEDGGTIELRNFDKSRPTEIASLDDSDNDLVIWLDFSPSPALLGTITHNFAAVAFEDLSIVIYSSKGRRLGNLYLDAPCYRLESNGNVLMAITIKGEMHRWDVRADREIHRPVSVLHLLGDPDNLASASLHANGAPIILLRSEKVYTFDEKKLGWVCIADGFWADHSAAWDGRTRGRGTDPASNRDPVRAVEAEINNLVVSREDVESDDEEEEDDQDEQDKNSKNGEEKNKDNVGTAETNASVRRGKPRRRPEMNVPSERQSDFESAVTLRHLETRMLAATILESPGEYKNYLLAYARRLADDGIRNQAEDLIKSLIGPIYHKPGVEDDWEPTILGHDKRQLLGTVLQILAKPRLLTGLVQPYQEILASMRL